jgi:23S rRNA pseudouridine1911/1915/1917 synthase
VIDPLVVLYEDEVLLAVSKPAGQFTQGSWAPPGEETLEQAMRRFLDPANPGAVYLGIVHRLDRPVSGVLVWTKTRKAASRLARQFETRRVVKQYWAIVEDRVPLHPPQDQGAGPTGLVAPLDVLQAPPLADTIWQDWLLSPGNAGVARTAPPETPGSRLAETRVETGEALRLPPGCSFLKLWPKTGRTHQLRVQAASRGRPILGDVDYGSQISVPRGIALHARSLQFEHPISRSPMTLEAPLPAAWQEQGILLVDDRPLQSADARPV